MSYRQRLTFIGKVSNLVASTPHKFGVGNVSAAHFMDELKPSAVRRLIRSKAGKRRFMMYQLVPPGLPTPRDGVVEKSEDIPLSLTNIQSADEEPMGLAVDYARHGGKLFNHLLDHLDILSNYSHGNFTNAVVRYAYQWVGIHNPDLSSKWELVDDRLADGLFNYITATASEEVDFRKPQLKDLLHDVCDTEGETTPEGILQQLDRCRDLLHSDGDLASLEDSDLTLRSLKWNCRQFKSNFQPFGAWDAQQESFLQNFRFYRASRKWLDSFVRNIPEHAYVMLFIFSKYGTLGVSAVDNASLSDEILKTAIVEQRNRRCGLPDGATISEVGKWIRHGYGQVVAGQLQDDQRRRWDAVSQQLIALCEDIAIPWEKLDKFLFIQGAIADFSDAVPRIQKDLVTALAKEAQFGLSALFNAARLITSGPWDRSEQISRLAVGLNEWGEKLSKDATAISSKTENLSDAESRAARLNAFQTAIHGRCTAGLRELDPADGGILYLELVSIYSKAILEQALNELQEDVAGTEEFAAAVKRYELRISARVDIEGAKETGNQGTAVATDVSSMNVSSSETPQVSKRVQKIRENAKRRRLTEAYRYEQAKRTRQASGKFNRPVPAGGTGVVDLPGGRLDVSSDNCLQFKVTSYPKQQTLSDAVDASGRAKQGFGTLSDAGLIVRKDDGSRVGDYRKTSDGQVELHYEQRSVRRDDDLLVSGEVRIPPGTEIQLAGLELQLKWQDLLDFSKKEDSAATFALSSENDSARQIVDFVQCADDRKSCVLTVLNPTAGELGEPVKRPITVRCDEVTHRVRIELPTGLVPAAADLLIFNYSLKLRYDEISSGTAGSTVKESFETPADLVVQGLSNEQLVNSDRALLEDISKMSNEFGKTLRKKDYWPRTIRSRIFREAALAAPPKTIPFGEIDLGVTFEAIARAIRHLGDRSVTDLFEPAPSSTLTSLQDLDLSSCFPVNHASDVVDVISQYNIICKKDQEFRPHRQELSNVLTAFESLGKDSGSRVSITFVNQSLEAVASAVPQPPVQASQMFFATDPTAFVHVLNCGLKQQTPEKNVDALNTIGGAFDRLTQADSNSPFRYPLVTSAQDLPCARWWYIPHFMMPGFNITEVVNGVKKERFKSIVECRNGSNEFSLPLATILSVLQCGTKPVGSNFDIGTTDVCQTDGKEPIPRWLVEAGWLTEDTLGTAIIKYITAPWTTADVNAVVTPGFWTKLASQRAINMSLDHYRAHPNERRKFADNFQPDYAAALGDAHLFDGGIGSLPWNPPNPRIREGTRLLIEKSGAANPLDDARQSVVCSVNDLLIFRKK